jgi:osmotically-inducible protein OsmY
MHRCVRVISAIVILAFAVGATVALSGCGVMKDTRLQKQIREELSKHRDVQVDKLTINVQDGVVTISGELYTREEIDKVVEIVSAIPGVVQVKNQMNLPDEFGSRNPVLLYPF